jgi:hypothetical protein
MASPLRTAKPVSQWTELDFEFFQCVDPAMASQVLARTLIGLLIVTFGCGPPPMRPPPMPPPPIDEHLSSLAPAGHQHVTLLDVERLRTSELWFLSTYASSNQIIAEIIRNTGIDPTATVDEIILVSSDRNSELGTRDQFLAIMKGRMDAEAIVSAVAALKNASPFEANGGFAGATTPNLTFVALTSRTLIVGSKDIVMDVVALANGEGRSIDDDQNFSDFDLSPTQTVRTRFVRGDNPIDRAGLKGPMGTWRWLENIDRIDAYLSISGGMEIISASRLDSEKDASRASRDLRRLIKRLRRNTFVVLIGIERFLRKIEVSAQGNSLEVGIRLDGNDIESLKKLSERLDTIRDLLSEPDENQPLELDPPMLKHKAKPGFRIRLKVGDE